MTIKIPPFSSKGREKIFKGAALALILGGLFLWPFFQFYDQIRGFAHVFAEEYGLPAVFLISWFFDAVIQPIPNDVLAFGTSFGGINIFLTALVAGLGSSFGGLTGYYIGRCIGPWRFRALFGNKLLRTGRDFFKNYGAMAVFVAGLSPIPFSAICWIGGIYSMSPRNLFIASLISRIPRYLLFAFLGWVAQ